MSQRVPSCDMDEPPNITSKAPPPLLHRHNHHHHHPPSKAPHASTDYEVAELTWENGNVAMHGHGHARITKPIAKYPSNTAGSGVAWDKQHQNGTLESIVDQATGTQFHAVPPATPSFISWLGGAHPHVAAGVDALVPCSNSYGHHAQETSDPVPNLPSVDGSSGDGRGKGRKRGRGGEGGWACASQGSAAPTVVTLDDTCELYGGEDVGFTTTSSPDGEAEDRGGSPDTENTSFGGHDSFSQSKRTQKRDAVADEEGDKADKRALQGVSSLSTKRSRAAAIHNQSERKRRDRINEKMRTLQKLVPNSSKTDKASMLDEVIDYLKQLQAQVQMMSRMSSIPQMMMPMTMPQLQMSMMANMAHMAQMAQMGLGLGMMDMTNLSRTAPAGMPPLLHPSAFTALAGGSWEPSSDRMQPPGGPVPSDPFSAFMAHPTQQSMNMDVYNKMAALYQQLYQQQQQPQQQGIKPKSST